MKKYIRKTAIVTCNNCNTSFEKAVSEIKRSEQRGSKHYCSLKCLGEANIKNLGDWIGKPQTSHLRPNNHKDQYSGFREFLRRARNRNRLGDLTLDDLFEQWNKQNGKCPYTGIELKLPQARVKHQMFETASLDRINSNKPYEKNNVVFVSTPINYMKNSMTEEETIVFCKKIAYFWKNSL